MDADMTAYFDWLAGYGSCWSVDDSNVVTAASGFVFGG